eukprot:g6543.t1
MAAGFDVERSRCCSDSLYYATEAVFCGEQGQRLHVFASPDTDKDKAGAKAQPLLATRGYSGHTPHDTAERKAVTVPDRAREREGREREVWEGGAGRLCWVGGREAIRARTRAAHTQMARTTAQSLFG